MTNNMETKHNHITLRLTQTDLSKLGQATKQKAVTRSQIIRIALSDYFKQQNIVAEVTTNPNQLSIA